MRAGDAIVILRQQPPGDRMHPQNVEEVSAYQLGANPRRLITVTDIHWHVTARNHAGENLIAIAQILIHRIRERVVHPGF